MLTASVNAQVSRFSALRCGYYVHTTDSARRHFSSTKHPWPRLQLHFTTDPHADSVLAIFSLLRFSVFRPTAIDFSLDLDRNGSIRIWACSRNAYTNIHPSLPTPWAKACPTLPSNQILRFLVHVSLRWHRTHASELSFLSIKWNLYGVRWWGVGPLLRSDSMLSTTVDWFGLPLSAPFLTPRPIPSITRSHA